jgi:hypothetical protein
MKRAGGVSGPAYDDAAIAAAGIAAHFVWREQSIELRDAIAKLPIPEILAALDDEATRAELLPCHRAQLRQAAAKRMAAPPAPAEQAKPPQPKLPDPAPAPTAKPTPHRSANVARIRQARLSRILNVGFVVAAAVWLYFMWTRTALPDWLGF